MTTIVQRLGDTQGARNVDGMFHVFRFVSMIANEHITTKVSVSIVGNCVAQTLVRSASGHFPWRILCNFSRPLSRGRSLLVSLLRGYFGINVSMSHFVAVFRTSFFFVQFGV